MLTQDYAEWQPGQAEIAAGGGAGRRHAKNADLLMQPSRAAHRSAWPHDSSEGEGHARSVRLSFALAEHGLGLV